MQDIVGKELKKFFARKGITQEEVAKTLGVSQQIVSRLLNGYGFGKKTADNWSKAFGLNPAWLRTGDGRMMLEDAQQERMESLAAIEAGSESFAQQLMKMISEGKLYTANVVRGKEEEISRLNREIGVLTLKLEQALQELEAYKKTEEEEDNG